MEGTTRLAVKEAQRQGFIVTGWPGHNLNDYFLGLGLGVDAICSDVPVLMQEYIESEATIAGLRSWKASSFPKRAAAAAEARQVGRTTVEESSTRRKRTAGVFLPGVNSLQALPHETQIRIAHPGGLAPRRSPMNCSSEQRQ